MVLSHALKPFRFDRFDVMNICGEFIDKNVLFQYLEMHPVQFQLLAVNIFIVVCK